jgi:hypothetical protein
MHNEDVQFQKRYSSCHNPSRTPRWPPRRPGQCASFGPTPITGALSLLHGSPPACWASILSHRREMMDIVPVYQDAIWRPGSVPMVKKSAGRKTGKDATRHVTAIWPAHSGRPS